MKRTVTLYLRDPFEDRPHAAAEGGETPSHALLYQSAERWLGSGAEPPGQLSLTQRGKPFFPDHPRLHFSISHSGQLWACAMGGIALGLDVQKNREQNIGGISRRFFHRLEQEYLAGREDIEFFKIWAAKESFCKYRGTGIDGDFQSFSVTDGSRLSQEAEGAFFLHFSPREGYSACLCTDEPAELIVEQI